MAYPDPGGNSSSSDAGKTALWFNAPPGNYTVCVAYEITLTATGTNGHAIATLTDAANSKNILSKFINTAQSPWSTNGTYSVNVTTTNNLDKLILIFDPTINFGTTTNFSTGQVEGTLSVGSIQKK